MVVLVCLKVKERGYPGVTQRSLRAWLARTLLVTSLWMYRVESTEVESEPEECNKWNLYCVDLHIVSFFPLEIFLYVSL